MKLTLSATVISINPTESSIFTGGTYAVGLDVMAAPMGDVRVRCNLPLFNREQTETFAGMFGRFDAVRVTFEAGEPASEIDPGDVIEWQCRKERWHTLRGLLIDCFEHRDTHGVITAALAFERGTPLAKDIPTWCDDDATRAKSTECERYYVAPPLVNGRPSCCPTVTALVSVVLRDDKHGTWYVHGSIATDQCAIVFCPFCGARLPEVPR